MSGSSNPNVESSILGSSLRVGAVTGPAGMVAGGILGVVASRGHPVITSLAGGIHSFAVGTSFWWLRSNILKVYYEDKATSRQRTYASTVSLAIAGTTSTKLLNIGARTHIIPTAILFSLAGCIGQASYNAIDRWQLGQANTPSKPLLDRIAESKWIPLKSLSDDEYRHILNEKLLTIEAEIALLDDKIEELQKDKIDVLNKGSTGQRTQ
ncbi:hypothetical protein BJY01DRAFT_220523 [Aspergillus pseudoustus]|uniref:Transmembrane protein n=1 Tax=Aspergillus pseudoustus TaxID=1810923 RepID=A0ABR4JFE5_9EURO